MIKKVAFIAHPTRDIARARTFFEVTLGLEQTADYGGAWIEYETPEGTTVALDSFAPQFDAGAAPYLALETDDIAAEVKHLREGGAEILKDAWENKQDDGTPICKMAILKDPDGHMFMLHEIAPDRE